MGRHLASRLPWLCESIERGRALGTVAVAVAVAVAGGVFAAGARADGDPASDYLVTNRVFLSSQSSPVSSSQWQLLTVVRTANRAGFEIRVAIISSDYDLGSITALWGKPRIYARFLGLELSSVYKQRLLVVMPSGFGFNWPKRSSGSAYRLLTRVPIRQGDGGLTGAAQTAVLRLASAAGIKIAPPADESTGVRAPGNPHSDGRIVTVAAAMLALALAAVLAVRLRRRPRPKVPGEPTVEAASPIRLRWASLVSRSRRRWASLASPSRRRWASTAPPIRLPWASLASPIRLRWAVPGIAVLLTGAVAAPIVAVTRLRQAGAASDMAAGSVATPPPFTWPAGRRLAPDFALRDQGGRRVTISAYRGRPLIVTFVDPLCRNLCPLQAKVLNDAVGRMPARQRPEILAVSVDVYANARANLLQDVRKWELVPQWRWAVGRPAQLAAVWKRYQIGVSVTTKKIARTTIHYTLHSEAAYVIDATGHERALFVWPFYPQDVLRTLHQLT